MALSRSIPSSIGRWNALRPLIRPVPPARLLMMAVFTASALSPAPEDAPSNSAVVGRYLLAPEIFDKLEKIGEGAGGEIQLTDGIADLLGEYPVYAYSFSGVRYDCGSKLGYLQATVAYGLNHPDTGEAFRKHLEDKLCR